MRFPGRTEVSRLKTRRARGWRGGALLALCGVAQLAASAWCAPATAPSGKPGAGAVPTDTLPRVIRSTLLWTPGDIIDVATAKAARANFVHTFPRPPKMRGLIPVPAEKEWLEKWSHQVAELHREGIFVSASVGSTCFNPEIFRQNDLDPEAYFARDENNAPSSMLGGSYGKELMTSCYSNPHWIERLKENVLAFARAGFDGIWYDVGGYVDAAVLYCHCRHCRDGWRQHLISIKQDSSVPLPRRARVPNFAEWTDREFLRWRWAQWIKWEAEVQKAVKAEYPKFAFAHNMGVKESNDRGMHMFIHATTNLYDYVHWEEWGHGTAPYSDITSYLLGAAVGPGKQVMLVQNDKPARNPLQHRIFLAEGYASGGVPQFGTRHSANSREFLTFIAENENVYLPGRSLANVAVVYSAWSQAIYAWPSKRWPAHWMGQLLLDRHVPFDYLIAEKDLNPRALETYKTIILPDQACLSDAHVEVVRAFVQRGGNVLTTGRTAEFDEEMRPRKQPLAEALAGRKVSGSARLTVGRGKAAVFSDCPEEEFWRRNPRDFAKTETLPAPTPLSTDVAGTFGWLLANTLPMQVNAPATTVVLARQQENRILLHLVNYNVFPDGKEMHANREIGITLSLPDGSKVSKVEIVSPDSDGPRTITRTQVEGDSLRFTVDELKVYGVVVVHLSAAGAPRLP